MSRALLVWTLIIPFHFLTVNTSDLDKSLYMVLKFLVFFAALDYFLFSISGFDISKNFLGVESRHISKHVGIGVLPRSTGLFGEPGTQANALLIVFLLIKKKCIKTKILYSIATILILSPYLILGYFSFLSRKNLIKILLLFSPIIFVLFWERILRILSFEDGSFLARLDAIDYFINNYSYLQYIFSTEILFTDAGFWLESIVEYGYIGALVIWILILRNRLPMIFLFLKIKAYAGWPIFFMFKKMNR